MVTVITDHSFYTSNIKTTLGAIIGNKFSCKECVFINIYILLIYFRV